METKTKHMFLIINYNITSMGQVKIKTSLVIAPADPILISTKTKNFKEKNQKI